MVTDDVFDDELRNDPVSADIGGVRLRFQFRKLSIEHVEYEGMVEWNRENDVVRKGPDFAEKHPPC